ncbi:hypothetical protein SASPL_156615 [Salvia splendens]|uniref:NAD(P)H dehydrogenase (quinone) n=1 Tax=Salvia splendens TaxID=180675 RepID=A0A8X8YVM5_SALSN|nr:hypothetical protein SASPL_156615 [Salvia splendens]
MNSSSPPPPKSPLMNPRPPRSLRGISGLHSLLLDVRPRGGPRAPNEAGRRFLRRRRGRALQSPGDLDRRRPRQNAGPAQGRFNPEIGSPADLAAAMDFCSVSPRDTGSMAAQMKAFFDSTAQLWKEQKLAGKPAGFFVSPGPQGRTRDHCLVNSWLELLE